MSNPGRPLSPHITIYRWPITMVSSILHRMSGVAMSIGLLVFAAWLMNAASGPDQYRQFEAAMSSIAGRVLLIAWTLAFFYHLANGIRHLVWDTGRGFEKTQANRSAWFVIIAAFALTAAFWGALQ